MSRWCSLTTVGRQKTEVGNRGNLLPKGVGSYASKGNHYGRRPREGIRDGVSIAIGPVGQDLFTQRLAASATGTTTSYRTRVSRNRGRRAAHTESSVYELPKIC